MEMIFTRQIYIYLTHIFYFLSCVILTFIYMTIFETTEDSTKKRRDIDIKIKAMENESKNIM